MPDAAARSGCGGVFASDDGRAYAYWLGSPGGWAAYGTLLAREYRSAACSRRAVG